MSKICPSGIKVVDNPAHYPDEIYVMGVFPGGIAKTVSGDDKTIYCELWALNSSRAPLISWDNSKLRFYEGTGRREGFKKDKKTGKYQSPKGWFVQLQKMVDGTFRLVYSEGIVEFFDSLGRLIKIQDRNKNKIEFYYNLSGQLSAVMDTMGRMINLEYYPLTFNSAGDQVLPISGRLWKIIDFSDPVRTVELAAF